MLKIISLAIFFSSIPAFGQSPRVDMLDNAVLGHLDQPGHYSLATVLGASSEEESFVAAQGDKLGPLPLIRLSELYKQSPTRFQVIADMVTADIKEVIKTSGEKQVAYSSEIAETMADMGKVPRYFDYHWLKSSEAAFPLVAVINRVDKKDFYPGTCGEVRYIYRITYFRSELKKGSTKPAESRSTLPLFLNVVYDYLPNADGTCQTIANKWAEAAAISVSDSKGLAENLANGALAKNRTRLKQIELNMQILRYPSELKNDFGGQAVYLFRIFQEKSGKFEAVPLENTPNVAEILKDDSLKASLIEQIKNPDNLKQIDEGTFVLENTNGKLLATRALSMTVLGRARLSNKPFTGIFGADPKDLAKVDISNLKFISSTRGLVERLNNSSCMGCHQAGGTAGFHMLGRTGNLNSAFNQTILPFSSHYGVERLRRQNYNQDLVDGKTPSTFRPPSFFPASTGIDGKGLPVFAKGKVRDLCMPKTQTDFSRGASCGDDTGGCVRTAQNSGTSIVIGECVETPNTTAGNVCRKGVITSRAPDKNFGDLYNLTGIKDTVDASEKFAGKGLGCTVPEQGVPLGRIPKKCTANSADGRLEFVDKMSSAGNKPKEMCVIQGGDVFDNCAKSSNPPQCLTDASAKIARAMLDTCSASHFCREDYICQKLPVEVSNQYSGATKKTVAERITKLGQLGVGFCVPNYFIFNMRADGHILPEGRLLDL